MLLQKSIPHLKRCQNISQSIKNHREIVKKLPLSVPLPMETTKMAVPKGLSTSGRNSKLTKLPNGLKVCTESTYGDFVTIGVAIDSGCRFENGFPFGVSRVVEKLAFNCSENFEDRDDVYALLEESSGIVDCQSTRDTMIYAASCHRDGVNSVTKVLSDTIWRPLIDEVSLDQAKVTVFYENEDLPQRIGAIEILLTDYIHQAAFQNNTIGYPKFGIDSLDKIRISDIYGFLSKVHTSERMVIGGVGVDHDEFVSIVSRHFDTQKSIWNTKPTLLPSKIPEIDNSRSQYTGGEIRIQKDLTPLTVGKPYPLLSHVVLGLEGCGYKDEDFVAFCVLQSLLGGGGAFSAGGPGKGMYARFYTDMMNKYHWVYSAIAYNHSYSDSGVFTLTASTYPENVKDALILLVEQVLKLQRGIGSEELARARTQLRSHLMMNLEVRPVLFEDMVRQVLGHGERKQPEDYAMKMSSIKDVIDFYEMGLKIMKERIAEGGLRADEKATIEDRIIDYHHTLGELEKQMDQNSLQVMCSGLIICSGIFFIALSLICDSDAFLFWFSSYFFPFFLPSSFSLPALFMWFYIVGFFLERRPCHICSGIFFIALSLTWYFDPDSCIFWPTCTKKLNGAVGTYVYRDRISP